MGKTFKELKVGDILFVWWWDTLYSYPITGTKIGKYTISVKTENGFGFSYDYNAEAFIYGSDTPHEYKIIGTSKEAVKNLLEETLQRDMDRLISDRDKWLASMADFHVGSKVWFEEEKKPYTVRACDNRYLVCTKPFNLMKTVFYTMVDLKEGIRGSDGYALGSYDYVIDEDCQDYLKELQEGKIEISRRNRIPLRLKKVKQ